MKNWLDERAGLERVVFTDMRQSTREFEGREG